MSKKNSCILMPQVNGRNSKLYKDLIEKKKFSRPITNWVYATYLQQGVADAMDRAGYKRDNLGQHSAQDVRKFLGMDNFAKEYMSPKMLEANAGFVDSTGAYIDFTDAEDALKRAEDFNNNHTGVVATVNQHGTVYNISVFEKNSNTASFKADTTSKLKVWDIYKQVFNSAGIDVEALPDLVKEQFFNAFNSNLYDSLERWQSQGFNQFYKLDALALLSLDPNSVQVQRAIQIYGSLEAVADEINNVNMGQPITSYNKARLEAAITQCQRKLKSMNVPALKVQVQQTIQNEKATDYDMSVKKTLDDLNKQFGIDTKEIILNGKDIKRLSSAAAEAIVTLERQIDELRQQQGNNQLGKDLSNIRKSLEKEIAQNRYWFGLLQFMSEASKQLSEWDTDYEALAKNPTTMGQLMAKCSSVQKFKDLKGYYYKIVEALADDSLTIDESISSIDLQRMRNDAKVLKESFDKFSQKINQITQDTMTGLLEQITGRDSINGVAIFNIIGSAAMDTSIMDYLYSMGRSSNPVIASMGTIIRNAQFERDKKLREYSLRVRRATDKLYKSGSDSSFMYEDDNIHIISDIDWVMYEAARERAKKQFQSQGLSEFEVKEELKNWEEQNTEDRVVDAVNGRTERVPNRYYRKQFPSLTAEQQEYYNTMMQIKGEIGSMLPYYAQKQYIAPQVRRSTMEAIRNNHTAKGVAKALLKKIANIWKIRENDTDYLQNALVDGDFYDLGKGDARNNPQRNIPIFFTKPLQDRDELFKNFSSGIAHFLSTAANYEAMNTIKDTVEYMADFVKGQIPDTGKVQKIGLNGYTILKVLTNKKDNVFTKHIVDSFLDQHMYGQNLKEQGRWTKTVQSLIAYTSFKGLSTNVKGAISNAIMGEAQMLIEAGAGEFYGLKDYLWAHKQLFGSAGMYGELMEIMTNNINHKGTVLKNFFDPMQEEYGSMGHQNFYKSPVMQLFSHDISFGLYGSGEYMIHMINMFAVLHKEKVMLNGKKVSLYDALDMSDKVDDNRELVIKQGTTDLKGNVIDMDYLEKIKKRITYVNQTTHGAMNQEDKGIIHQYMLGRAVMNFRQWMVGHYSRRFRGRHHDFTLGEDREGYYTSVWKWYKDTIEDYDTDDRKKYMKIIGQTVKDICYFFLRSESQMANMEEDQIYNIKRAQSEIVMFLCLLGLSFALGAPDDHKKEFWYRWLMYITRRLLNEEMSSIPVTNIMTVSNIISRPIASASTANQLLYPLYGFIQGDAFEEYKRGKHKGENKYWYNIKKYTLPFFKDIEQMEKFDTDDNLFSIWNITPSGY